MLSKNLTKLAQQTEVQIAVIVQHECHVPPDSIASYDCG